MTLIAAFLSIFLLLGLGGALILTTMIETHAAAAFARGTEAFHAADGALEYALQDLDAVSNWTDITNGSIRSAMSDGPPTGTRWLEDGTVVRLDSLGGSWRPYLYSRVDRLLPPGRIDSVLYVVVWVSSSAEVPGALLLQGHAYGPRGGRRMLEATVTRDVHGHLRISSWHELRQ